MKPIEFLTRGECMNSPIMRQNLDAALKAAGRSIDYSVIDLDTLPVSDIRRGYPTPTVLYGGDDLFGEPKPTPPLPKPT